MTPVQILSLIHRDPVNMLSIISHSYLFATKSIGMSISRITSVQPLYALHFESDPHGSGSILVLTLDIMLTAQVIHNVVRYSTNEMIVQLDVEDGNDLK